MRRITLAVAVFVITAAQAPRPAFEAASVKVNPATNFVVRVSTFRTASAAST
jgi:hypothetical protein